MKKIIEIDYVGIEDIQEILDDVYAIQQEGHYAEFNFTNFCERPKINIKIWLGGWSVEKDNDYCFEFYVTDKAEDVRRMDDCKSTLKNLLTWNEVDAATVEGEVFI